MSQRFAVHDIHVSVDKTRTAARPLPEGICRAGAQACCAPIDGVDWRWRKADVRGSVGPPPPPYFSQVFILKGL